MNNYTKELRLSSKPLKYFLELESTISNSYSKSELNQLFRFNKASLSVEILNTFGDIIHLIMFKSSDCISSDLRGLQVDSLIFDESVDNFQEFQILLK